MKTRKGIGASEAVVPGGSHGFWGPKVSPLKEQLVLLASDLSFQPTCQFFKYINSFSTMMVVLGMST